MRTLIGIIGTLVGIIGTLIGIIGPPPTRGTPNEARPFVRTTMAATVRQAQLYRTVIAVVAPWYYSAGLSA